MEENYKNQSMVNVAYEILKETTSNNDEEKVDKKGILFKKLYDLVCEKLGFTEEEKNNNISRFYTNLSLDGRFICLAKNKWDLRANHTFKEYDIDISNIYEDYDQTNEIDEDDEDEEILENDDLDEDDNNSSNEDNRSY